MPAEFKDCKRSPCPVTNTLDAIGDKWTLLIIRDLLFFGKKRYKDFAASPESIPTNILAHRLKHLGKEGIINKKTYQTNPPRYEYYLTKKGQDLRPLLIAIMRWSSKHLPYAAKAPAKILKSSK
jgi:DNA-binding HxlR family transcriptional regulator